MSFVKRWSVNDIQQQLRACQAQVSSVYNDGFTAWGCKQDLLQIKYELDEFLKTAPKFVGEEEFIHDLEKKTVWKTLKRT